MVCGRVLGNFPLGLFPPMFSPTVFSHPSFPNSTPVFVPCLFLPVFSLMPFSTRCFHPGFSRRVFPPIYFPLSPPSHPPVYPPRFSFISYNKKITVILKALMIFFHFKFSIFENFKILRNFMQKKTIQPKPSKRFFS